MEKPSATVRAASRTLKLSKPAPRKTSASLQPTVLKPQETVYNGLFQHQQGESANKQISGQIVNMLGAGEGWFHQENPTQQGLNSATSDTQGKENKVGKRSSRGLKLEKPAPLKSSRNKPGETNTTDSVAMTCGSAEKKATALIREALTDMEDKSQTDIGLPREHKCRTQIMSQVSQDSGFGDMSSYSRQGSMLEGVPESQDDLDWNDIDDSARTTFSFSKKHLQCTAYGVNQIQPFNSLFTADDGVDQKIPPRKTVRAKRACRPNAQNRERVNTYQSYNRSNSAPLILSTGVGDCVEYWDNEKLPYEIVEKSASFYSAGSVNQDDVRRRHHTVAVQSNVRKYTESSATVNSDNADKKHSTPKSSGKAQLSFSEEWESDLLDVEARQDLCKDLNDNYLDVRSVTPTNELTTNTYNIKRNMNLQDLESTPRAGKVVDFTQPRKLDREVPNDNADKNTGYSNVCLNDINSCESMVEIMKKLSNSLDYRDKNDSDLSSDGTKSTEKSLSQSTGDEGFNEQSYAWELIEDLTDRDQLYAWELLEDLTDKVKDWNLGKGVDNDNEENGKMVKSEKPKKDKETVAERLLAWKHQEDMADEVDSAKFEKHIKEGINQGKKDEEVSDEIHNIDDYLPDNIDEIELELEHLNEDLAPPDGTTSVQSKNAGSTVGVRKSVFEKSGKQNGVIVIREPLHPNSTQNDIEIAEQHCSGKVYTAKCRRQMFRALRLCQMEQQQLNHEKDVNIIQYSAEELLEIGKNKLSKQEPECWAYLTRACPDVCLSMVEKFVDTEKYALERSYVMQLHGKYVLDDDRRRNRNCNNQGKELLDTSMPPPGFGTRPHGGSGAPWAASKTGFGVPQTGFGAPQTGLRVPQSGFGVPQTGFGVPQTGFGVPQTGFGVPQTGFGITQTGFGIPKSGFGLPNKAIDEKTKNDAETCLQPAWKENQSSFNSHAGYQAAKMDVNSNQVNLDSKCDVSVQKDGSVRLFAAATSKVLPYRSFPDVSVKRSVSDPAGELLAEGKQQATRPTVPAYTRFNSVPYRSPAGNSEQFVNKNLPEKCPW